MKNLPFAPIAGILTGVVCVTGLFCAAYFFAPSSSPFISYGAPIMSQERTLIPETDSLYDLGTSTKAWREVWLDRLCLTADTCYTALSAGGAFEWTPQSYGVSTSTTLGLLAGMFSVGSSTISNGDLHISGGKISFDADASSAAANSIFRSSNTLVARAGTSGLELRNSGNAVVFKFDGSNNLSAPFLTSNGFVKTSGGTGALSVDTTSYLSSYDAFSHSTNFGATFSASSSPLWARGTPVSLAASSTSWFDQVNVGSTTAGTMATSTFYGNVDVKGYLQNDSISNALVVDSTGGTLVAYTGTTCTNQFVRSLNALGSATCATVGASDVSLANLTATSNGGLLFSGTYNGSTARTIGLDTTSLSSNALVSWSGSVLTATGTPQLTVGNLLATSTTLVSSFQQLLANASTTLQNFTFVNATGTSATTTNFFSTTASSTNLFAQVGTIGTLTLSNSPLGIAAGGSNARSFGTSNGVVAYDGTRLVNFAGCTLIAALFTCSNASTTNLSVGTWLKIPAATDPSVADSGAFAINTTAASSSLRWYDGTAERAAYDTIGPSFTLASTTALIGTTTIPLGFSDRGETWTTYVCNVDQGAADIDFGDGTNWMPMSKLTSTANVVTPASNNTFTLYEARKMRVGSSTPSWNYLTCTVVIRKNAD